MKRLGLPKNQLLFPLGLQKAVPTHSWRGWPAEKYSCWGWDTLMPVFVAAKKERERLAVPAQLYPSDQIHSSRGHISMETNLTINLWNNLHLERWGCGMGLRKMRHIFRRKQQGYFLIGNNIPQIRIPSILQASITCNWWSISSSLAWIRLNKSSVVYCNKGKKRRK